MQQKIDFNLLYLLTSVLILSSYFFGFYIDEDAGGGGKVDFVKKEWGNINLFLDSKISSILADPRYASGRTPLYLIVNKFNPFTENMNQFRISYLVFATTIPILFFIFLKKNFKFVNLNILIFLSCTLMVSPYFRTMSFWADQEGLAIFFLLLSLISFSHLSNLDFYHNKKKYYLLSIITLFLSSLSFYSDQKYIFLSIFIYYSLITKNNFKFFFNYSLMGVIFALPALYLFYVWGGLLPIESQFRLVFSPSGFNYFFSIIGIYLIPIFIILFFEKKIIKLFLNLKKIDLFYFLIISVILFLTLPESPKFNGVGVVFKFLSLITSKLGVSWNLILSIYYILNLFFLFLFLIFFKKNFKNYIFFTVYALGFMSTFIVHQQYVDPLFFLLIFSYFSFIDEIKIFSNKYIISYFLFYFFLLLGALYYRNICLIYFLKAACQVG
ncbi:MAG TPA: hypothetical protein EYQ38_00525 [Candidatus Pelagibacter sp.]|nr:hypothetical protein [Candidatus Pelagibacter sp.]